MGKLLFRPLRLVCKYQSCPVHSHGFFLAFSPRELCALEQVTFPLSTMCYKTIKCKKKKRLTNENVVSVVTFKQGGTKVEVLWRQGGATLIFGSFRPNSVPCAHKKPYSLISASPSNVQQRAATCSMCLIRASWVTYGVVVLSSFCPVRDDGTTKACIRCQVLNH